MSHDFGAIKGENPVHRVAISLEEMPPVPPVNPSLENQFVKLLEDERQQHEREQQDEQRSPGEHDDFKQRGFRFVEKMLLVHAFTAQKDGRQQQQADGALLDELARQLKLDAAGAGEESTRQLRHEDTTVARHGIASDLGSELAECIRRADLSNTPWRAEIGLSRSGLPATRLLINAEDVLLHLHFVSANTNICDLLREQRGALLEKLSRVTSRLVMIDIDAVSAVEGRGDGRGFA